MTLHCLNSIRDVRAADWDALVPIDQPFLSHAFLLALELSESVGSGTGWQPAHAVLHNDVCQLVAAMPGWQKLHSRGEYVFDQGWAEAAFRAGLGYYPKWLSAVPFSPITGPRLLGAAKAVNDLLMQLPSHSAWAGLY